MSRRRKHLARILIRPLPVAGLAIGLGVAGCTGGHLDLTSRFAPQREPSVQTDESRTASQSERDDEPPRISRLLSFSRTRPAAESALREKRATPRVFSSFVDRFSSRDEAETSDPFLADAQSEPPVSPALRQDSLTSKSGRVPARDVAATAAAARRPAQNTTMSDEEMWRLLEQASPSAAVAAPTAASLSDSDLPEWARTSVTAARPVAGAARAPDARLAALRDDTGLARLAFGPDDDHETPEPAADEAASRRRLEGLLADARIAARRGDLPRAYQVALEAVEFAEAQQFVFTPQEQQPSDLVREISEKMRASRANDPFAESPIATSSPAAALAQAGAFPALPARDALPFADDNWRSETRPSTSTVAAPADRATTPARGDFDQVFPSVAGWRGVVANSPVSLAVVDAQPSPQSDRSPSPVQHALLTDATQAEPTQGPLLRRVEEDRDRLWHGKQPHEFAISREPMRGPALRAPAASEPSFAAPPPPLEIGGERGLTLDGKRGARAADGKSRRGNAGWWILGGLSLLGGGAILKRRQRSASQS